MRKFILLSVALLAGALFASINAQTWTEGYTGYVDISGGAGKIGGEASGGKQFVLEASTVQGAWLDRSWYVGGGAGIIIPMDMKKVFVPVFADARLRFTEFGEGMVPFLEARAGVIALNTTGNGKIQPYFAGSVGTSVYKDILLTKKPAINRSDAIAGYFSYPIVPAYWHNFILFIRNIYRRVSVST